MNRNSTAEVKKPPNSAAEVFDRDEIQANGSRHQSTRIYESTNSCMHT